VVTEPDLERVDAVCSLTIIERKFHGRLSPGLPSCATTTVGVSAHRVLTLPIVVGTHTGHHAAAYSKQCETPTNSSFKNYKYCIL
jgi:hypothetical protein